MKTISSKIKEVKKLINDAEYILIGAGAGLSTSAGIEYSGKRFENNFSEYIKKYHVNDMYTASFIDFKTEEEKWAYWAKHIYINNTGMEATETYKNILELVKDKNYFVITTNADDQFFKANFDENKIFRVQGSYRYIQCQDACHDSLYDDTLMVEEMLKQIVDLKIPTELVPKCPVCGGPMEMNLRKDSNFVQDANWYKQSENYEKFLNKAQNEKTVLLEFGVGFNTPGIIRLPFEQMTMQNKKWNLVRFNKDFSSTYLNLEDKVISVSDNIDTVIKEILDK